MTNDIAVRQGRLEGGAAIADPFVFLHGGGDQAKAIRTYDWASTPLGPIERWSGALKVACSAMLPSRFPQCLVWGPELITLYNDAFRPILGDKPEALGRPFSDVWQEAWNEIGPIAERAFAGEATFIEDFPLVVQRHAGEAEQAYFTFCYSPVRDGDGRIVGMIDTVIETTARVAAERQSTMLNRELAHRIGNLMTVVGAITDRTLKTTPSPDAARGVLTQRLGAMGRAQAVLANATGSAAPVRDIVVETLAAHVGLDRIGIEGPPVMLSEQRALAFALAINELATNAVKYGALSVPEGRVSCTWSIADGTFRFDWCEEEGPVVAVPTRRGFGSDLIERHVGDAFAGTAALSFAPAGLCYTITAPLA